jgi:tRNA (cytidine32/uridine32-2'-O)-methyltransferase
MATAFPSLKNAAASIRIVLVGTSHPGNIGAAARAMRTMGLARLVLVAPRDFPHDEATALAAGADDVLAAAQIVATLDEALAGCTLALGCTARARTVALPEHDPRAAAARVLAAAAHGDVALVFGNERSGLSNDELQRCHAAVHIPSDPAFSSLNLAAAVQVCCYELHMAMLAGEATPVAIETRTVAAPTSADADTEPHDRAREADATLDELEGLFGHLQQTLADIDFLKGRSPLTIMRRLRRLFLRAALSGREVLILRGIFSDAQRCARLAGVAPRGAADAPAEHT